MGDGEEEAQRGVAVVVAAPHQVKYLDGLNRNLSQIEIERIDSSAISADENFHVFMAMARSFSTVAVYNAKRLLPKQPTPEDEKIYITGLIITEKHLNSIPDGHERESYKEAKSATYVRNQWDEGVDQNL